MGRLERDGVITGYRAEIDPRALGYQLAAVVRVKPAPGQIRKVPELAEAIPQVVECHRVTGEDCFHMTVVLRSIEELAGLLDRFLLYGETTTSVIRRHAGASPRPAAGRRVTTGSDPVVTRGRAATLHGAPGESW